GAAAQPPPPPLVEAQPQPGVRGELARATSTPPPPPTATEPPAKPSAVKSDGQRAEKVVRKPKKAEAPVKLLVKKPEVAVGEKRLEPGKLQRSLSIVAQPTQRSGDEEDGRSSATDTNWSTFTGHLPDSPTDAAKAADRKAAGFRSLSDTEPEPDSEAASTAFTARGL
ncbi:hypothetical protein AAVH_39584, partial [Aphelenchoides avenae]